METLMLFPTKRHLLISCYCPTRGHAGGLRLLDIYSKLRQIDPKAKFDLFTQKDIAVDWKYDIVETLFDNIYDAKGMPFNFETFRSLKCDAPLYDIIDLQYSIDSDSLARFRSISKKIIFTPMESRCRSYALHGAQLDAAVRDEAAELAEQEKRICRTVDEVICVSQPDAEFLREHLCLADVSAIETGVSEIEFGDIERVKSQIAVDPLCVIFVAYFGSPTNVEALVWYLREVHPLVKARVPAYRLDVVGRGDLSAFVSQQDANLRLVGEVPELLPEIARAAVGVAPALSGAGFRGKINQYAIMAVPSVVSPVAAAGLAYEDGLDIFIGATPQAFANGVVRLLKDQELRTRIGQAARAKCLQLYSWTSKSTALQRAYAPREPAIHVIVPSYNHARYITRRIESIVQQTYLNIDITVIDDCSSDNSDAVLQTLQKKYDFKYIRREKNSGSPFTAWQYAAENFSDGLIWVCESDDFAEPDFAAHGVDAFIANRSLVLYYSNSWVVDEEDNRVGSTLTYFRDQWKAERWLRPFISNGMTELANFQINGMTVPNMSSALMSRDAFAWAFRPRIKRFKLAGDWLFIGELMRKGDVAFSPDHLSNFRRHRETARANTSIARSQAEYFLTKFRLHLRTKKPMRLIAVTLWCDLIRFLYEDCSALDILKQMLAVSWTDTARLLFALGPSLFVHRDIRQDLKRKREEIRLRNATST
jgi:glycosyltransferase involved in cell wall biosynthesis